MSGFGSILSRASSILSRANLIGTANPTTASITVNECMHLSEEGDCVGTSESLQSTLRTGPVAHKMLSKIRESIEWGELDNVIRESKRALENASAEAQPFWDATLIEAKYIKSTLEELDLLLTDTNNFNLDAYQKKTNQFFVSYIVLSKYLHALEGLPGVNSDELKKIRQAILLSALAHLMCLLFFTKTLRDWFPLLETLKANAQPAELAQIESLTEQKRYLKNVDIALALLGERLLSCYHIMLGRQTDAGRQAPVPSEVMRALFNELEDVPNLILAQERVAAINFISDQITADLSTNRGTSQIEQVDATTQTGPLTQASSPLQQTSAQLRAEKKGKRVDRVVQRQGEELERNRTSLGQMISINLQGVDSSLGIAITSTTTEDEAYRPFNDTSDSESESESIAGVNVRRNAFSSHRPGAQQKRQKKAVLDEARQSSVGQNIPQVPSDLDASQALQSSVVSREAKRDIASSDRTDSQITLVNSGSGQSSAVQLKSSKEEDTDDSGYVTGVATDTGAVTERDEEDESVQTAQKREEENQISRQEIEALPDRANELDAENKQIASLLEERLEERAPLESRLSKYMETERRLRDELRSVHHEINKNRQQISSRESDIEMLNSQFELSRCDKNILTQTIENLKAASKKGNKAHIERMGMFQDSLQNVVAELSEANEQIASLEEEKEMLKKDVSELAKKKEELEGKLSSVQSKKRGVQQEILSFDDELFKLIDELSSTHTQQELLEKKNQLQRGEIEALNERLEGIAHELNAAKQQAESLGTETSNLKGEVKSLKKQDQLQRGEIEALNERLEGTAHELNTAKQQAESLGTETSNLKGEVKSLKEKNRLQRGEIEVLNEVLEGKDNELNAAKQQAKSLGADERDLEGEVRRLNEIEQKLRDELRFSAVKIVNLNEQILRFNQESNDVKPGPVEIMTWGFLRPKQTEEITKLEKKLAIAEAQNKKLDQQIEELQKKLKIEQDKKKKKWRNKLKRLGSKLFGRKKQKASDNEKNKKKWNLVKKPVFKSSWFDRSGGSKDKEKRRKVG